MERGHKDLAVISVTGLHVRPKPSYVENVQQFVILNNKSLNCWLL